VQVTVDTCDRTTVYAVLREEESLTDDLRTRAIERARQIGAQHVEFWRPPYGSGGARMDGFVERASVPPEREPQSADDALVTENMARESSSPHR
jgi:hypothetical protein